MLAESYLLVTMFVDILICPSFRRWMKELSNPAPPPPPPPPSQLFMIRVFKKNCVHHLIKKKKILIFTLGGTLGEVGYWVLHKELYLASAPSE